MNVKWLFLLIWFALPAHAQGFAGLGADAEGFAIPKQGTRLTFPEDHGPHPAYRIEWWYVTSNLTDSAGRDYGIQWTLFRSALAPYDEAGWSSPQIWMGHAGLTTPERHFFAERFARGGIGQAGVQAEPFAAWIDDWTMEGARFSDLRLYAADEEFSYTLSLSADGPLIEHGDRGYSVKSASGQASYYYSQPHYQVTGTLNLPDGPVEVTGSAWLDREWSSQPLDEDQTGWDWFSLHFADNTRLMAFRLRDSGAGYTSGTWITADGDAVPFGDGALKVIPKRSAAVNGRDVPVAWTLRLPERDLDISVEAIYDGAWMGTQFPYWEGPVRVSGSHEGRGYLEMTGYDQ